MAPLTYGTYTMPAYAKVNLYLAVTGQAENGYHTVETVMQSVSLSDTVTLTVSKADGDTPPITLTCSDPTLPTDESNLAYKAARLFARRRPMGDARLHIHIEKHIPVAGGLAGGSTDGAAVLLLLNRAAGGALSQKVLLSLGAALGADVPFCILANSGTPTALGTHYGEEMTPLPTIPMMYTVVISAGESVSTPRAYRLVDALPPDPTEGYRAVTAALDASDGSKVLSSLYNRFEAAILPLCPRAAEARVRLRSLLADAVLMSGSGPTVIGFFRAPDQAEAAAQQLCREGFSAVVAQTCS